MKHNGNNEDVGERADEVAVAEPGGQMNSEEAISVEAYLLWQAAGCPEGRDHDFWFAATKNLRGYDQPEA